MSKEQFQAAVLEALKREDYAGDRSEEELIDAMKEYQDIIDGCFEEACSEDSFGFGWHADNAAWNITMCI
ncbi:MAG: hypothetical protein IJ153_10970 [Clostridia bacterium]|nr:hypothetical protein [Clostridia bacterium]MBQ9212208.1 hypothetical protein [Clostridia bacterium]